MRSADPVRPSLPPAGGSPAPLTTASHTALRVRGCMRRDRSKAREVPALRGSSSFFLSLPHHLRPSFTFYCTLVPGRGAPGVPSSREDRAAPVKGGRRFFLNSSQLPCRRCGETNWKFAQARLGVVLIPDSPYLFLNEPFKAMDLRARVSV